MSRGALGRRLVVGSVVVLQIVLVARAYLAPPAVFGFQMFPESSTVSLEVARVTGDGERVPVTEPWPGGYRWGDLVPVRGLGTLGVEQHATAGADATLHLLGRALEWAAANTPLDRETRWLEAVVTVRRNGGPPETVVLRSPERPPG